MSSYKYYILAKYTKSGNSVEVVENDDKVISVFALNSNLKKLKFVFRLFWVDKINFNSKITKVMTFFQY